jgi:hypothetical protein
MPGEELENYQFAGLPNCSLLTRHTFHPVRISLHPYGLHRDDRSIVAPVPMQSIWMDG